MNMAFFEVREEEKEIIRGAFPGHKLKIYDYPLSESNIDEVENCDIISTFIYSKVNSNILKRLPNVKLITTRSTGFEHIDLDFAKARKIEVKNVPSYGESCVAEYTFSLILSIVKKIRLSSEKTRKRNFSLDGLQGQELKGKTLGVIGTGAIGLKVIKIAKAFEMDILAYDIKENLEASRNLNFSYTSLKNLLKSSDIISLHVPAAPETKHIINKNAISQFKPQAILINTARGDLINTLDLVKALQEKKLSGAALDVLENESFIKEKPNFLTPEIKALLEMENVIITPHNAFNTLESNKKILDCTIESINNFISNSAAQMPLSQMIKPGAIIND